MPAEKRNLSELHSILMSRLEVFDAHLDAMSDSGHPFVSRVAVGFSQKEDRERASVISTAQGGTKAFESPQLVAATTAMTLNRHLPKKPVLFLLDELPPFPQSKNYQISFG